MPNRVSCQNCGAGIDLPDGFDRAKIRCPGCGYYAEVPADLRSAAAEVPDREPPKRGKEYSRRSADSGRPVRKPAVEPEIEFEPEPEPPPATARPVAKPAPEDEPALPGRRRAPGGYDVDAEETYSFADPLPKPPSPPPPVARPRSRREPPKVRPQANPRDHRPVFEPEEGRGQPLLPGSQEEDDDRPYAVPGTGLVNCPKCKGELPIDSTLCVHCGLDLSTGAKADRVFQPISGEWEEGWPFHLRLALFAGMQVLNLVGFILGIVSDGTYGATSLLTHGFFQVLHTVLQAFLLGSYDTLALRRTARGQATITRTRRLLFYKLPPEKINWKDSHAVGLVGTHDPGVFAWLICIYLLLLGCFPGILFYLLVIRPERVHVHLCDVYGSTDEIVFRSKSRDQAHEIASLIGEATGLWYRPVM
jgi:hypothetical protein